MKKLLLLLLPLFLFSCTGTFHLTNPHKGITYSSALYYQPYYPYHTVTYISPPIYINKYSWYNPYYQYTYSIKKKGNILNHYYNNQKNHNTYYGHRKK